LAERVVIVSYESVWVEYQRFSTRIAAKLRCDRPALADKWHLDEIVISIRGQKNWLWRAVDASGDVLARIIHDAAFFCSLGRFPGSWVCRAHQMSASGLLAGR
jgi:transposase-like protein